MGTKKKQAKITLEGIGFKYSLFEVKEEDKPDFFDNDRGVYLKNRFKEYVEEDMRRIDRGEQSRMIQFCTLVDNENYPAEVTVTQGKNIKTYHLSGMAEWRFIVSNVESRSYEPNMPVDMPVKFMKRIEALINEYLDDADEMTVDALNGEYITFFNLYTPEGKMMLCMRSRDSVRSEFVVDLPETEELDIDKLSVLCRHTQGVTWYDGVRQREYDANSLIYDSRWQSGDVYSHREQNVDYFVTSSNPSSIDARWFESWAV